MNAGMQIGGKSSREDGATISSSRGGSNPMRTLYRLQIMSDTGQWKTIGDMMTSSEAVSLFLEHVTSVDVIYRLEVGQYR